MKGGEDEEKKEKRREGGKGEERMREWKEEMMGIMKRLIEGMEGIKEIRDQGNSMKEEIEGLRRNIREKEE